MRKNKTVTGLLTALSAALILSGCSLFADADSSQTAAQNTVPQQTTLEQQLPADTQIIHQKLTYLFTPSDSFFVVQDGDFANMSSLYQNSGRFVQYHLVQKLMQHGSQAVAQTGYFDPTMLQQEASYRNCTMYMTAKIEHLYDQPNGPKELSIRVNTYSTRSNDLLDSVILNARAETLDAMFNVENSVAEQLINNYINAMYRKVSSL